MGLGPGLASRFFVLTVLLAAGAGCGKSTDGCGAGPACPSAQRCVEGSCRELCNADVECANNGVCQAGTCWTPTCGDGVVEGREACDNGINNADSGACTNSCQIARCGDGFPYAGVEECDDGNDDNTDACVEGCVVASCGDGWVQDAVEECDNGDANDNEAACKEDCTDQRCGDGFVGPGEQCDDGNDVDTDNCTNLCVRSTCGNGELDDDEDCDDQNDDNTDDCLDTCVSASCGDGFVWAGHETCDDGDGDLTDDCPDGPTGTCAPAVCGDGFEHAGVEECDDGNHVLTDECPDGPTGSCAPAVCGDGFVHAGVEECDDGNHVLTDECPDGPGGDCQDPGCTTGSCPAGDFCNAGTCESCTCPGLFPTCVDEGGDSFSCACTAASCAPAACVDSGATCRWVDDFDASPNLMSVCGDSIASSWEWGAASDDTTCPSGSCWATDLDGNYNNCELSCVEHVGPDLEGVTGTIELSFSAWYDCEHGATMGGFDGVTVRFLTASGDTAIEPEGGWDVDPVRLGSDCTAFADVDWPAWGQYENGDPIGWGPKRFVIDSDAHPELFHAGFGWRIYMESDLHGTAAGFYFDDLTLEVRAP